jgi:hypothetical protein
MDAIVKIVCAIATWLCFIYVIIAPFAIAWGYYKRDYDLTDHEFGLFAVLMCLLCVLPLVLSNLAFSVRRRDWSTGIGLVCVVIFMTSYAYLMLGCDDRYLSRVAWITWAGRRFLGSRAVLHRYTELTCTILRIGNPLFHVTNDIYWVGFFT